MKRFLLIITGALGSLAAILSITPPQFGHGSALGSGSLGGSGSTSTGTTTVTTTPTPTTTTAAPTPTKSAVQEDSTAAKKAAAKAAAKKAAAAKAAAAKAKAGSTPTPTPAATHSQTPTPVATASSAPATSSGVSGTFTGATFEAREPNGQLWGNVTVTVVIKDGKIVSSTGRQSPSSRGPYAFSALDPFFATNQMTLKAIKAETASMAVADRLVVSNVTYSSLAYWSSIRSALSKAGI